MFSTHTVRRQRGARRGSAIVETALVLSVFCLMLFGIFEYCRYLFVLHLVENSAREGARYASVNLDKPATFGATDYTDGTGKLYRSVQNYTKDRAKGIQKQFPATGAGRLQVAVFPVDATGLQLATPIIRPKSKNGSTFPDPFVPDSNTVDWNTASFPDRIAVSIKGTYKTLLPSFIGLPKTIDIKVTAMTSSES
jgi:Flp pilus assembly protein TadG